MQKLLLISIMVGLVALPAIAARDRSARRALKKTVLLVVLLNVGYELGLIYLYPHLF